MKKTIIFILSLIWINANAQTSKKGNIKIEKEEYKKDTSYVLKGKFPDFQILYTQITSPGDVTPNQKDALINWIKGIKPQIDSVKVTK